MFAQGIYASSSDRFIKPIYGMLLYSDTTQRYDRSITVRQKDAQNCHSINATTKHDVV